MYKKNEERVFVREGGRFPFATVVLFKENETTFHAWQPEYDIEETAATMDQVISLVADKMGEMITDPEYDYLDYEHNGFFVPYTISADEVAQDLEALAEIISEIFELKAPVDANAYIFVSVLPKINKS